MSRPDTHRRVIERRFAAVAIGLTLLFTGAVLVWRWMFDDAPWSSPFPPTPAMSGWEAFNLYYWVDTVGMLMLVATGVGLVVRWVTKRQGATVWVGVVLAVLVCLQTAGVYTPYWGMTVRRAGRLARVVEEPAVVVRTLALSVVATMVLAAVFVCVTRLRRTPQMVRQSALSVASALAAILLNLCWLQWIIPISNDWSPVDWRQPELMVPFRPCRGALLWKGSRKFDDEVWSYPVGRIDDVWLHFADPATPGRTVWAVSAFGEWEEGYLWLRGADVAQLRVRRDDPAVVHCDSRPRPERVAPESWHRMGIP